MSEDPAPNDSGRFHLRQIVIWLVVLGGVALGLALAILQTMVLGG